MGGLSALGAGLYSIGIPKNSVVKYETSIKAGKFVLVAHGTADEVAKARDMLKTSGAEQIDSYEPSAEAPWNLRRVVHLHRRAGFAASWGELQRDLAEGPEASIARLLDGKLRPLGAPGPAEFERIATVLGEAAISSSDAGRLKAWWFYRLLFSRDPLGERLTLMWHNHFATSIQKVGDPAAMRKQNETLRRLAEIGLRSEK